MAQLKTSKSKKKAAQPQEFKITQEDLEELRNAHIEKQIRANRKFKVGDEIVIKVYNWDRDGENVTDYKAAVIVEKRRDRDTLGSILGLSNTRTGPVYRAIYKTQHGQFTYGYFTPGDEELVGLLKDVGSLVLE